MSSADLPTGARPLFDRISSTPTSRRADIVADVSQLASSAGLSWALQALFRQQVKAGYVLFDPADQALLREKLLSAPDHRPALRLQWNPLREMRLDHQLLRERGVIATNIDPRLLINQNSAGNPCYLCPKNIAIQTPGEILLPQTFNGENYFLGANFAPITANHFTVISAEHRPQSYHIGSLRAGFELVAATGGKFRALFNGRAGASILEHEHLHASDTRFPLEDVPTVGAREIAAMQGARALQPDYPLPVWLTEGDDLDSVIALGDRLITSWHAADPHRHSENLLMSIDDGRHRLFVIPRDLARMTAPGRTAAMGSFETAGLIVLSHDSEHELFESADGETAQAMLAALCPERLAHASAIHQELGF